MIYNWNKLVNLADDSKNENNIQEAFEEVINSMRKDLGQKPLKKNELMSLFKIYKESESEEENKKSEYLL